MIRTVLLLTALAQALPALAEERNLEPFRPYEAMRPYAAFVQSEPFRPFSPSPFTPYARITPPAALNVGPVTPVFPPFAPIPETPLPPPPAVAPPDFRTFTGYAAPDPIAEREPYRTPQLDAFKPFSGAAAAPPPRR